MRKLLPLAAACALPLAACATNPYGSGYGSDPVNAVLGTIGALGSGYGSGYGYGSGFGQAAAGACANYASRYGAVQVTSVRQTSSDKVHVYGYVSRGYGSDDFDCSFRSDGRISDFDI
jgi:hypothetical protein